MVTDHILHNYIERPVLELCVIPLFWMGIRMRRIHFWLSLFSSKSDAGGKAKVDHSVEKTV